MLVTKNISLNKPEYHDPADIEALNRNSDKLDEIIEELKGLGGAGSLGYDSALSGLDAETVKEALDALAGRSQIVVMETDIPVLERKKNTFYLKVTDTSAVQLATGTILVSPTMGIKIVD